MSAGGRRAAARRRQVSADPYDAFRVLVMNFDDLTDKKGHAFTNNLNAADGVSGGVLNKTANVTNSRLTLTSWSSDFNLAATNIFVIELDAMWAAGTQNFAVGVGVSGSSAAWSGTNGNQFYLGRYNGNAIMDYWSGALNTSFRAGAITAGVRTRVRVVCNGTRMSMYVGTSRVATTTTLMVPVTTLSSMGVSDGSLTGGSAINNGGAVYGLRITKDSTAGFDPNSTTITDTPLDNM